MPKYLFALMAAFACACGSASKTAPPPADPPTQTPPQEDPLAMTVAFSDTISIVVRLPSADWTATVNNEAPKPGVDLLLHHDTVPNTGMELIVAPGESFVEEQVAEMFRPTDEDVAAVGGTMTPITVEHGRTVFTLEIPIDGVPMRQHLSVFRLSMDPNLIVVVFAVGPVDAWDMISAAEQSFVDSIQPRAL